MKHINHNGLAKLREANKKTQLVLENIEPIIASNDGYVLTQDGRIAFRFYLGKQPVLRARTETKDLGLDTPGITPEEAYALASRIAEMPHIEKVALDLQRTASKMRNLLLEVQNATRAGNPIPSKTLVNIAMMIEETAT